MEGFACDILCTCLSAFRCDSIRSFAGELPTTNQPRRLPSGCDSEGSRDCWTQMLLNTTSRLNLGAIVLTDPVAAPESFLSIILFICCFTFKRFREQQTLNKSHISGPSPKNEGNGEGTAPTLRSHPAALQVESPRYGFYSLRCSEA